MPGAARAWNRKPSEPFEKEIDSGSLQKEKPGSKDAQRQPEGGGDRSKEGWKGSSQYRRLAGGHRHTRSRAGGQIGKPGMDFTTPRGKDPQGFESNGKPGMTLGK